MWLGCSLIAAVVVVFQTSDRGASPAETPHEFSVQEVKDLLSASVLPSGFGFESSYTVKFWGSDIETTGSPPPAESFVLKFEERHHITALGNRLRTDLETGEKSKPHRQINVWTDGLWTQRIDGIPGVQISNSAVAPDAWGNAFLFNRVDGRVTSDQQWIPGWLQHGKKVVQEVRNGLLVFRWEWGDPAKGSYEGEVTIELGAQPTLVGFKRVMHGPGDRSRPGGIRISYEFAISEWTWLDGQRFPAKARYDTIFQSSSDPSKLNFGFAVYERDTLKILSQADVNSDHFTSGVESGVPVADSRSNLAYRVGEKLLFIDGQAFELSKPIAGVLGDDLPGTLDGAKLVSKYVEIVDGSEENDHGGWRFGSGSSLALGGGILLMLAGVLVRSIRTGTGARGS